YINAHDALAEIQPLSSNESNLFNILLSINNARSNASLRSFENLRRYFWRENKIRDSTLESFDKQTVSIYDRFVEENLCDDRAKFEYACIRYFGLHCEKNLDMPAMLLWKFSELYMDPQFDTERAIYGAHLMASGTLLNKQTYGLPTLFDPEHEHWHECSIIAYIMRSNPQDKGEILNSLDLVKRLTSEKLRNYLSGIIYEKTNNHKIEMFFYESVFKSTVDNGHIKRVANSPAENMFEENAINIIMKQYVPHKWGLALGRKIGDYYWKNNSYFQAADGYSLAAQEGDIIALFSYERTKYFLANTPGDFLLPCEYNMKINPVAEEAYLKFIYLFESSDQNLQILQLGLEYIAAGNNIARWFLDVFLNKDINHNQILAEMREETGILSKGIHMAAFLSIPIDNFPTQSAASYINYQERYNYYEYMRHGYGVDRNDLKVMDGFSRLMARGYYPASLKWAELLSDRNFKYYDLNKALKIYQNLADCENPDGYTGLISLCEKGVIELDEDTLSRLQCALIPKDVTLSRSKTRIAQLLKIIKASIAAFILLFLFACARPVIDEQTFAQGLTQIEETPAVQPTETHSPIASDTEINLLISDWIGWKPVIDANGGLSTADGSIFNSHFGIDVSITSEPEETLTPGILADALVSGEYNAIGCFVNQYAEVYPLLQSADISVKAIYAPATSDGWDYIISNDNSTINSKDIEPVIASRYGSNALFLALSYFDSVSGAEALDNIIQSLELFKTNQEALEVYNDKAATWLATDKSGELSGEKILGEFAYGTTYKPEAVIGVIVVKDSVTSNNNLSDGFVRGAINASREYKENLDYIKDIPLYNDLSNGTIQSLIDTVSFADENDNKDIL
ncbi:MAG: hypothetical protein LBQ68_06910, partial [Clostridiales bacterium]|nr:hypothetical protein [Clostridiales bacterium]